MREWRFLPWIIVRATGFPVAMLDALRFPATVRLFREIEDLDRTSAALADELVALVRDEVDRARGDGPRLRALSTLRRRLRTGLPVVAKVMPGADRWNDLLAARDAAVAKARATYDAELADRREVLRRTVADEQVLDALLLCSNDIRKAADRYVAAGPVRRTSPVRKVERKLVSYLQRLCAKNETQSHFGPINYGRLGGTDENLVLRRGTERVRARESFPAQWTVELLAADVLEGRPRRGTMARLDGARLVFPSSVVDLDPAELALYRAANGRRTVAELAAATGETVEDTQRRVHALATRKGLVTGPILPPDLPDPLAWLLEHVADEQLGEFHRLVRSFARAAPADRPAVLAEVAQRFTRLCGRAASRSGGAMYADRAPLFEECLGDVEEFTVGGGLLERITTGLGPILDLATAYGAAEHRRDQAAAADLVCGPDLVGDLPLLRYLAMLAARPVPHRPHPEVDTLLADLAAAVDRTGGRLTADDLPRGGQDDFLVTSVDLMLRADSVDAVRAGRFQVVLGEMHPQPLPWVFPTAHFLDPAERDALGAALADAVAAQPGAAEAAVVAHTRSNKIFPLPLPGTQVELRPRLPNADAVPAAALTVEASGGTVRCVGPDGPLRFHPPLRRRSDGLDPVAPLAFPPVHLPRIGSGDHTPRVEVDGVVLQRERWDPPVGTFAVAGDDFEVFHGVWRAARRLGLPNQVYLRVPGEPKPFFVDFESAFLAELTAHLARSGAAISVSEALPGTAEAWLDGHTCELRMIAIGETA